MPLDAAGEVIVGAVEVAGEVLGELGASDSDRRRRRRFGCWWQLLIFAVLVLIVWMIAAYA